MCVAAAQARRQALAMSDPIGSGPSGDVHGFSWHTADAQKLAAALARVQAAREKGGKTAVAWETMQLLPDGFRLGWKKAVSYRAGYMWFTRVLGDLVAEPGQTSNWRVVGYRDGSSPPGPAPPGAPQASAAGLSSPPARAADAERAPPTARRRLRT